MIIGIQSHPFESGRIYNVKSAINLPAKLRDMGPLIGCNVLCHVQGLAGSHFMYSLPAKKIGDSGLPDG